MRLLVGHVRTGAGALTACCAVAVALAGCSSGLDPEELEAKAEFHYKLANGHFYESQIVPALVELQECMKFNPQHPDAHHLKGFIFFGRKEYATAERHFRKALQIRSGFHEARSNLGALLMAMRRWRDAVGVLKPLLTATLYRTPWVAHNNIGYAHHRLQQLGKAKKHYRLSIFHNPKFCKGYNNLGSLYKELGQAQDAIEFLGRAARKCEKYPDPHFHMGEVYISLGRTTEARSQFSQCFADAPESAMGRRCRRRL